MSFIHPQSCLCTNDSLDIFKVPLTQTSVEESQFVEIHPLSSVTDGNSPIEFSISGSSEHYFDLASSEIYVRAQILNGDNTNVDGAIAVGPVNYWLHSLFSQVQFSMNDKLISMPTNNYPYRSYIESLLNFGREAKESQLTSGLFYKDTAGHFEDIAGNNGMTQRRQFTNNSRLIDMMGKLHLDMFFQNRYLLNGVNMKIKLIRSRDSFSIISSEANPDFKVKISEICLFMRKVKINPDVQIGHMKALEKTSAKYPITRVDCKVFSVPIHNLTVNQENIYNGPLPKRIIIALVDADGYAGNFAKNPFLFKHYHLNYLALHMNGRMIPSKPLQPNFERFDYLRAYQGLFSSTGQLFKDVGNNISRNEYNKGYTLFSFDLSPEINDGDHFDLIRHGNLRLEMRFAQPLPNTINVILYSEFQNLIYIDKSRNVMFDYAS